MKTTVVPAQVTTVEDRIAGNLGLSQLMLLVAPVFGGSLLFAVLPPTMHGAAYKYVILTVLLCVCALLAIRIKGKILALWLVIIARYNVRPRYYVADRNTAAGREDHPQIRHIIVPEEAIAAGAEKMRLPSLATNEAAKVLALLDNPAAKLRFETNRKGALYVRIAEVKK